MLASCRKLLLPLAVWLLPTVTVYADPDIHDTRLLAQPAVSARHVAFIYADDLWVADLDGRNVRRLTSEVGIESNPVFSPDGATIAFSARYDGNVDVYTIPVEGGSPTRLTWHPNADMVRGFTADGKAVLFSSARNSFTNRYAQLFTVPLTGGMPTQLLVPHGVEASFSPDGSQIAFTPLSDRSMQWKHYRGGTHSRIWIYRFKDSRVEEIPQPKDGSNDLNPQWVGSTIYFRSDRNGEYNLFAYSPQTKAVKQLTKHRDFPVLALGAGGGRLIYEQAGYLHLFEPVEGKDRRMKIGAASDLVETRPRYIKGAKYIRNADVSPSGARAVFEFRGEIVTVPAEKGDPRNLTESPGVHERSPAWSSDGRSIAYFSDQGGEYRLHVRPASGKGAVKIYDLHGAGYYYTLTWSPDSKKLAYVDNSQSLFWIDLASGKVRKIASEPIYMPGEPQVRPAWSPDSAWIAYSLGNKAAYHTVFVHELASGKSRPVTDGMSDAVEPVFDAEGRYLYFLASTDAGPVNQWFSLASVDMNLHRSIYLAVLRKRDPSPLARESDEERTAVPSEERPKSGQGRTLDSSLEELAAVLTDRDAPADAAQKGAMATVVRKVKAVFQLLTRSQTVFIDFDGIDQRIMALPVAPAGYTHVQAGPPGKIFYLDWPVSRTEPSASGDDDASRGATLKRFDLGKRKSENVSTSVANYWLTASHRKALVFSPPESWSIVELASSASAPGKGKLKVENIEVRIEPRGEWPQIFDEAWRINRDYFYDPGMHGADWPAIKKKYAVFLPHLATRGDLDRVIGWMLSELSVGHSYLAPGERPFEKKTVPGGLLGADFEVANGRYRFRKVYGGLNWSPELRSPLTAPGVNVVAGEYLLAVRGIDLKPPKEVFALFENTAQKSIEITVGPKPDGSGSRTVIVEPLADEHALRNRDWVEGNLRKVQKASGGRVAYVYVPDTAKLGHTYFKRYFYPQCDKQAIIIDERFNGGGELADYYIDHLRRPFVAMWAMRYGSDLKTPGAAIDGPKVMLIDETAGSGGDLLPWMFRKFQLGPLIGKRTWGGLVGILGYPVLMDGGQVTAPNLAIWTEEGWIVENQGVPPDIEVEQWPADVMAGKDPQLEKAIKVVLADLNKHPPKTLQRPRYPIRVTK
ncbi:MAG: PDZ domain-containing protein [Thermoguttaceae bacterium]